MYLLYIERDLSNKCQDWVSVYHGPARFLKLLFFLILYLKKVSVFQNPVYITLFFLDQICSHFFIRAGYFLISFLVFLQCLNTNIKLLQTNKQTVKYHILVLANRSTIFPVKSFIIYFFYTFSYHHNKIKLKIPNK